MGGRVDRMYHAEILKEVQSAKEDLKKLRGIKLYLDFHIPKLKEIMGNSPAKEAAVYRIVLDELEHIKDISENGL